MASSKLYDLVVHFDSNIRVIGNVDSDKYSFLELTNDIFEATVDDSNTGMGMSIVIQGQNPKSLELFELKSDDDVMHLFHMHEGVNEIHLYLDIIPAVPFSTMFKSVSKEDRENARKSNVEASSSTPHIIVEESNSEPEIDSDKEEQYDFTSDDVEWVGESDDDHSDDFSDCHDNVDVDDMVVSDSSDGLFDIDSDVEAGNHQSSDSDKEGRAIDRAMEGIPYSVGVDGKVRLVKDMLFNNVNHFREVLTDYVIQEGVEIVRVKNDRTRVTAYCKAKGCNWRIHATATAEGTTFKIKICEGEHNCIRVSNNHGAASTAWIAKKLSSKLHVEPDMSYNLMQHELNESYGLTVNTKKLYRAKKRAREESQGTHARSYKMLHLYAQMVRDTNPGSIAIMQLERLEISNNPTFKRFFLSFDAMKKGFRNGCRPFIGVDGCHLKGPYEGVLLATVSLDGNCGLFPIVVAILESCEIT